MSAIRFQCGRWRFGLPVRESLVGQCSSIAPSWTLWRHVAVYREIWAMLLACGAIAVAGCQGTPIATEETEGAATAMAAAPLICFVGEEAPPVVGTYDVVNPFDTPAEIVVLQPSCVCTGIEGADEH